MRNPGCRVPAPANRERCFRYRGKNITLLFFIQLPTAAKAQTITYTPCKNVFFALFAPKKQPLENCQTRLPNDEVESHNRNAVTPAHSTSLRIDSGRCPEDLKQLDSGRSLSRLCFWSGPE
jgi:hypothetical protein